jgi:hypothetical protein
MSRPFGPLDTDAAWAAADRAPSSSATTAPVDALDERAEAWPEDSDTSALADAYLTIPGMGDPGAGCGEWAPREFCDECGEVHLGPHRCQQRECPDCWSTWAIQRAERAVTRLQSARWSLDDGLDRRTVHLVASPPEGSIRTLADVQRFRQKAHERVRDAGMRGGVSIFHGFRVTDDAKRRFRETLTDDERPTSAGVWRFVRENGRPWREQTYWSPHFHYVGLATEVEPDPDDEWIIKRLSTAPRMDSLTDESSYEGLAKIVTYLMSHATFEPANDGETGRKAVSWFGDLHPSRFQPDPTDVEEWSREPAIKPIGAGPLAVIRRLAAEATGAIDPESGAGLGEPEECEDDECDGRIRPIFDFPTHRARLTLDRDTEARLATAFEWAVGEVVPPPGMRSPTSEQECSEAFEYLLQQRCA